MKKDKRQFRPYNLTLASYKLQLTMFWKKWHSYSSLKALICKLTSFTLRGNLAVGYFPQDADPPTTLPQSAVKADSNHLNE
jgi:hypothetical protein